MTTISGLPMQTSGTSPVGSLGDLGDDILQMFERGQSLSLTLLIAVKGVGPLPGASPWARDGGTLRVTHGVQREDLESRGLSS
ncbi:hypothetical protein GUJ93_ZPchr0009g1268 [Zizania palustris]|uniref:Uncharacterized protein n=1 Tax=Zizania palustris TaxID=103762 RepID=A0A8J5S2C4_ZIZPA|nr:hypothetical protein GUJ93_ZPchr0009g1268 [Zizania palustris]